VSQVNTYIENLHSSDEAERIYAAEDLGYSNAKAAIEPLVLRLRFEGSRAVREAIFQALARIEAPAVIDAAVGLLASNDSGIRNQAIELLQRRGAEALPALKQAVRSPQSDVRKFALDVLGGMECAGTSEIYSLALEDTDLNVVITAVEHIGRARKNEMRASLEALLQAAEHPMLIGACLEALSHAGDDRSLARIAQRFPEVAGIPDLYLPSWLKLVGALGSADDLLSVAELLSTRGPHVRAAVVNAIFALHSRHPLDELPDALTDSLLGIVMDSEMQSLVRYEALRLLGRFAARGEIFEIVASLLSHEDRLVRIAAVESLARCGASAGPVLAGHRPIESDQEVRQAIERALETVAARDR
jgi:HEAT repeat protein